MTSTSRLRAVPQLVGKTGFDYRFDVASQVLAARTRMCLSKPSPRCLVQARGRLVCGSAGSCLRRQQASPAVVLGRLERGGSVGGRCLWARSATPESGRTTT